ncbi:hypothetical protein GALL_526880 [mine drainage metagenome]|uniref:Uncharacterized protein n=1 Tax=mine drainage metagenome TaxID=410659 RepID=A0A1J5PDZ7_9ZZZZ
MGRGRQLAGDTHAVADEEAGLGVVVPGDGGLSRETPGGRQAVEEATLELEDADLDAQMTSPPSTATGMMPAMPSAPGRFSGGTMP